MKKRGMKKRVLAALMTACMVVGSVPGVSLADATTDNSGISYTLRSVYKELHADRETGC